MDGGFMTDTGSDERPGVPLRPSQAGAAVSEAILKAIYQRRAVRAYTDESVTRQNIELLLDAAIHAPSAVNSQPWAFVIIQDPLTLSRYAEDGRELLTREPPAAELLKSGLPDIERLRQMAAGENFELFHGAPALIVIYATSAEGVPDCFLAAENLMLAAWALGLGTCPIGLARPLFNRSEVKEELAIPVEWTAALPIVVGWPSGETPPSTRHPARIVAWQ
jgi:nitroreductase